MEAQIQLLEKKKKEALKKIKRWNSFKDQDWSEDQISFTYEVGRCQECVVQYTDDVVVKYSPAVFKNAVKYRIKTN